MYTGNAELLALAMKIAWTQNVIILEADLEIEERRWYLRAADQNRQKRKKPCAAFNTQHRAILCSDCTRTTVFLVMLYVGLSLNKFLNWASSFFTSPAFSRLWIAASTGPLPTSSPSNMFDKPTYFLFAAEGPATGNARTQPLALGYRGRTRRSVKFFFTDLKIVLYLRRTDGIIETDWTARKAADGGFLKIMRLMHSNSCERGA